MIEFASRMLDISPVRNPEGSVYATNGA